jgi:hypothetical protein
LTATALHTGVLTKRYIYHELPVRRTVAKFAT